MQKISRISLILKSWQSSKHHFSHRSEIWNNRPASVGRLRERNLACNPTLLIKWMINWQISILVGTLARGQNIWTRVGAKIKELGGVVIKSFRLNIMVIGNKVSNWSEKKKLNNLTISQQKSLLFCILYHDHGQKIDLEIYRVYKIRKFQIFSMPFV